MPSDPRPKTFYATRELYHNGNHFCAGDEVPQGRTLRHLMTFGDTFVTSKATTTPSPSKGGPAVSEEQDNA